MATKKISAGILMYKKEDNELKVLLAHPGGPFFKNKDEGHWSIPKGEPDDGEELFDAAVREFEEETGIKPEGKFIPLGTITQKGGKVVHCWAVEGEYRRPDGFESNKFTIEWPPRSKKFTEFPEIDKVEFFDISEAKKKIKEAQIILLERLEEKLK